MIEEILKLDSKLFLYLNNLGTPEFDSFWSTLSKIEANILMYLFFNLFILLHSKDSSKIFKCFLSYFCDCTNDNYY